MESPIVGKIVLFLLGGIGWFYCILPRRVKRILSVVLGGGLFQLGLRRKVVQQNLALAYSQKTPEDLAQQKFLLRENYNHLAQLAFEIMMLLGGMESFVRKSSLVQGAENWVEAKKRGKGVIFLTGHVGNWEVMAASGCLLCGMDVMMVTKHLKPEWLHQAIEKGRARCGVKGTYEPRTMRDILGHLKKNGTLGMVLDQYAGPPVGVRVPVFGVPVSTTTALAALVKRTEAVVLPVCNYRDAEGRFRVEIAAPLGWQSDEDSHYELALNTARFSAAVEAMVRAHPEQWLWIHRRFKGDLSPLKENEWRRSRARS